MHTSRNHQTSRRHLLLIGAAMATSTLLPVSHASTWPSQPIRLVVPYPAGGINDVVARMFADQLSQSLGQPFIVENKPGAGATIGMAELAKANDQHTFAFAAISPLTLNPYLMKVGYNPLEDITPVASVMYSPVYVLATTAFQGKSFDDVLTQAKTPKGITVATSGYGTLAHIMVEQLARATGGNFVHVPYKGGSQLVTDAAGAQFDLLLANPFAPINALIDQGKLRVLATTGPQRAASYKDVPTLAERGFDKANQTSLFGFYAPATTDSAAIHKFHAEVNKLLQSPQMQQRLRKLDNVPHAATQDGFASAVRKDYALNGLVIEQAGIKAE